MKNFDLKDFLKNFIILLISGVFMTIVGCLIILLILMSVELFLGVYQYTGLSAVCIVVGAAVLTMLAGFALAMLGNVGRLAYKSRRENKNK